jgi:hypothetical protein
VQISALYYSAMPYLTIKYLYRLTGLLLPLFFACCATKDKTKIITKPPAVFTEISKLAFEFDTKYIADKVSLHGKSIPFYCGIETLYGDEYFIYLDDADSLTFIQLKDKSVKKAYIGNITRKMGEDYVSRITDNQLLLLNREKKYFVAYKISQDFAITLQKSVNLNKFNKIDAVRFTTHPDATRFILKDSSLFINYGILKTKNYIDKKAIVHFNLNDSSLTPRFIIDYPITFHKVEIRNQELLFNMVNDSCLAFGYMQHDAVGLYNVKSNSIIQTQINHNCRFLDFDEGKHGNLGYTWKYLLTNEKNFTLFSDTLQHIYLLKKLGKAQKKDITLMECYVFDKQLNPVYSFKLNQTVCQAYIYKYRQGFLAFNDSLNKAYYYAFN